MTNNSLRVLDEDRLELPAVCGLLGWSLATAYRHCRRGLEHLCTGPGRRGKIITSRQAVERYLARLNGIEDHADVVATTPGGTAGRRRVKRLAAVDDDLDRAGIR
jgi:hypothetical protein